MPTYDLNSLNEQQRGPVLDTEGAVLVTAGAGSGKTRLLTHRIAYLIAEKQVKPYHILAITFTNKAANEMRERLEQMIPDAEGLWVSTFHAMCVRMLRRFIGNIGYAPNFSIYGEAEKEACVKKLIKEEVAEDGLLKNALRAISDAKTEGLAPDDYRAMHKFRPGIDTLVRIYAGYEAELKTCNALDYDDLLLVAYRLLSTDAEARAFYQEKFRYIHVDEFQDTNEIQYKLVRILSLKHGNILAVGDEDQSIYGWRGAKSANIFDFIRDFNSKVYKLEQNYRSTKSIVQLANTVIKHNRSRMDKTLFSNGTLGEAPVVFAAQSDGDEAQFVIKTISDMMGSGGYSLSDFAVLMRLNALSRSFEERLMLYGVSHKVFGGFKFYERKEVKDLIAYIRIMVNHNDREAILRVINFPKRGIGAAAVQQLVNYADVTGAPLFDVIRSIEINTDLPMNLIRRVLPFTNVLACMENAQTAGNLGIAETMKYVCRIAGFKEAFAEETEENKSRRLNIRELVGGAEGYERMNPAATLLDYLQNISLYSDTDEYSDKNNCVSLATIHSAKGLEFKVVFLVGLEEGLFPDARKAGDAELEEERRLMYVAVTRARERLFLSYAKSRFRYGTRETPMPSRFLTESGLIEKKPVFERSIEQNYEGMVRSPSSSGFTRPAASPTRRQPAIDESRVSAGTRVRHAKFGEGTVLSLDHSGETCAEVEFPGVGRVMLMLKYAPLELIDSE